VGPFCGSLGYVQNDADLPPVPAPDPGRPAHLGWIGRSLIAFLVLAVGGAVGWLFVADSVPNDVPTEGLPASASAGAVPAGPDEPDRLIPWAARLAPMTGLDGQVLRAYGNAELYARRELPDCRLSWATLAGIARIESNHGRFQGIRIDATGRTTRPILGPPLDGSPGVRTIVDSDRGRLDGDLRFDRAVGPFQFLPDTWRRYGLDGNGDGATDPHNIEDAAVAAGRYLCSGDRDLSTGQDWWEAVLDYNNSVSYGRKVFAAADDYARASLD
jgi:hypothetical protein